MRGDTRDRKKEKGSQGDDARKREQSQSAKAPDKRGRPQSAKAPVKRVEQVPDPRKHIQQTRVADGEGREKPSARGKPQKQPRAGKPGGKKGQ